MNAIASLWARLPPLVIDILAVLLAALDALINSAEEPSAWSPLDVTVVAVACAGLLLRRRFPLVVFLLTLPAAVAQDLLAAPIIALFTLSRVSRRRWLLVACAALFAFSSAFPWPFAGADRVDQFGAFVYFVYQFATAAAPVALGQLLQAREDLAKRLVEIEDAKEHEQALYAQTVLARERNQLAREMHDVVSHQVSLIAVQAAALQVTAGTEQERSGAEAIRELSVATLDELRTMVALLRMAGSSSPGLTPQPTSADIRTLIAASGLEVELDGELPREAPAAVQRAVYRTIQEALTNARKHSPGAPVSVRLEAGDGAVGVTVANGPARSRALALPGSRVGLVGLRERSELLGGTFRAGSTPAGGFEVHADFPLR
ncbi:sensor histidine kinase [Leifsonia shinshuensis]